MKLLHQVPRNALVWIIIAQFTLVAPHAGRVPTWILLLYLFAALWRIQVYRGQWSFPGRWVKAVMMLSGFAGIYFSYSSLIGLEPTVALLLTAFALKLIETVARKDVYVLIFLAYFVCITEFLFTQDLLIVGYSLLNVIVITTALVALHQPGEHQFNRRTIRLAGVMVLQAVPLMLVLFFLFPRIGPLWTVPVKSHAAKTGISDFMKPGDIANLSQSADVAFRVQFEGEIPDKSQLYWRGLVFSKLEEGAWTNLGYFDIPAKQRRTVIVDTIGDPLRYSIIIEPTQQNWLFGLRHAVPDRPGILVAPDFRLYSLVVIEDDFRYSVESWPEAPLETKLSSWRREVELRLPAGDNPRTRELANAMRLEAGSDREFVDAALERFNVEPFVYTLKPPLLPDSNPMDAFLFDTLRGFCEHYAYAFVVMMRAAGVPARVVAGYQGGEINPVNRTVVVHQFDAHAWAEVWLPGEGWVRVDPTASVAPERIEMGLEDAVAEEGTFLAESPLSPLRYRSIRWLNQLRLRYDALTYRWQSWVVGFDGKVQFDLLRDVFGEVSAGRFAAALIGAWALVLIPVALSLLRKRDTRPRRPLDREYLRVCDRLEAAGYPRRAGESAAHYATRISQACPAWAAPLEQITALYNTCSYEGLSSEETSEVAKSFYRAARGFRPRRCDSDIAAAGPKFDS
jgi:transglutaminase-like putative cysteine protease